MDHFARHGGLRCELTDLAVTSGSPVLNGLSLLDVVEPAVVSPEGEVGEVSPRTVLYVDDAVSFGGSLVVTAMLTKYLDPARYRAVVVGEAEDHVLEYLFGDTARYYRIPRAINYRNSWEILERLGAFRFRPARKLLSYGLTVVAVVANLPYHLRLASVILRERVDVIHQSNGAVRPFLALFGRPMLATLQGIPKRPYGALKRRALERFGSFIMISEVVREHFVAAGGPPEIAELIPNPTDPVEITDDMRGRMRDEYGIPRDAKVFGILGRVIWWKGQKEFLAAAETVLGEIPDAVAIVVGDAADSEATYYGEVRALATESQFADRIVFTGYVEDVSRVYAVLDVAAHASIAPEPFGLVVIEALGYGIPIVAADTGAPPEIVEDGVDGFLVDPRDATALASALMRLLTDENLRHEMGERGKRKVFSKYHARSYTRRVEALYDRAIRDRLD